MLKYLYLICALYNSYIKNMNNCIAFLILASIALLFEIKDLLTKKEETNGNN